MAADEGKTTRFLIYETDDAEGLNLDLVGAQLAKGADEALRLFYPEPPDSPVHAVAVSENHFRVRPIKAREPRVTIGEPVKVGGSLVGRVGGAERLAEAAQVGGSAPSAEGITSPQNASEPVAA